MGKWQAVKFDFPLAIYLIGQKGEKAKRTPKYRSQSDFIGRKGNLFPAKGKGWGGLKKKDSKNFL